MHASLQSRFPVRSFSHLAQCLGLEAIEILTFESKADYWFLQDFTIFNVGLAANG